MHGDEENKDRAWQFFLFGLVLVGAGGAMHFFRVTIWPWWLYGIGGFVWFQGLLKWMMPTPWFCHKCHHSMNVWHWRKQVKSEKQEKLPPLRPDIKIPPLVLVKKRITGETVEQTLAKFEEQCSAENYQTLKIEEKFMVNGCTMVRYEVRWKYSVLDDDTAGFHESWAVLEPTYAQAGDPDDTRFHVFSATAEHHNL